MHERSLVKSLIEQVIQEGKARQLGRIHEIQLQIGEFSGVEPRLVNSAFEEMAATYWDTEVQLRIEVVALMANCSVCRESFRVEGFHFVCPHCGSGDVHVTAGEEMRLISLSAERESVASQFQ
jgi:hydrogenase nickel incorporation protein HypA/HybF